MRKSLVVLFLLFSLLSTFAQQRTHLPYSIFGIGQIRTKGSVRNMGMGRSGLALSSSYHLNNLNPASYHTMDSISFFFDFGVNADFVKYSTSTVTQHGNDINLRNIAMGFRISKHWSSSIGIAPYSTVGYKIQTDKYVEGTMDQVQVDLTGSGGLTHFYWDNSYLLFGHLSLGMNVTYLFGSIEYSEKLHYTGLNNEVYSNQTSYLNKIYADFGFQYFFMLNEKTRVTLGGVFGNNHPLNFKQTVEIHDSKGTISEEKDTEAGTFDLPAYIGGGLAVQYDNKLTVSADYVFQNWSVNTSKDKVFSYNNTSIIRAGIEYVPGMVNRLGYMGRLSYRVGYYHEDSYLVINGTSFADDGLSVGVGIPFFQNKTSINLAYNYGSMGTTENRLIQEKYHSVMVSLTLHDWWFIKRKYD
jgi:hypothetical protein